MKTFVILQCWMEMIYTGDTGVVGGVLKVTDSANDQPGFCELCMDSSENLKLVCMESYENLKLV